MKINRHAKILDLISRDDIETQEELAEKLNAEGFPVTQATVSRDIREMKLTKVTNDRGRQVYKVMQGTETGMNEKYLRILRDGFVAMDMAQNILVVKTVAGMAMAVAAALDAMKWPEIAGCIAGDDTIMCAVRSVDETLIVMDKIKKIIAAGTPLHNYKKWECNMLANIHVKNMALIKEADISLGKGLNILSGETGAGKSILLGSIAVALGLQNFKGFAREDADYALSELVFVIENEEQRQALLELEIPVEDGEVIISRRLSKGRTTSKINGETVPVSMVRKAGTLLIDIHGQHENQSLLHIRKHLELLDDFAGEKLALAKEKYKARYQEYGELKKELQQAQLDNATRAKEMDFLSFEIGEIEEAALQKGEDEALEDDYKRLANGKEILESVLEAHQLCASDGASEAIGRALRSLASVSEYDSDLKALYNQLMDVDSLLNDFNREISGYADELDVDEETLKKTEERLDLINHLKTKYGDTIEKIQAYCEEKKQRFAVLENYEGYLAERKSRFAACKKQLQKEAENLTVIRKEAAQRFTEQVKQALMDLNFLDVQFELDFRLLEDYMVSGQDEVCFMISTNPGQPLRPVQDTASGGELSRIMLAVKSVMADQEKVETLIFDEIDSGISGRTAQMVSEKLALIAGNHQVICITHLAQIAAMADVHFMIEKKVIENETQTSIRQLDEKESIDELARILGGAKITQMVLDSAKEMRQLAKNARGHGFQNEPE